MARKTLPVFIGGVMILLQAPGCIPNLGPSTDYNEALAHRSADQVTFEDSLTVFFADYVNPYPYKEVLWIASYIPGPVEIRMHDTENDSLDTIIRFEKQDSPLYPLAYHADERRMLKCVVFVDGKAKCAKIFPEIAPLAHPQWGTTFTVESRR